MPSLPGTKRLSDKDVKEIFACLHETGKRPSEHLTFQIVPVVSQRHPVSMNVTNKLVNSIVFLSIAGSEWFEAFATFSRI